MLFGFLLLESDFKIQLMRQAGNLKTLHPEEFPVFENLKLLLYVGLLQSTDPGDAFQ